MHNLYLTVKNVRTLIIVYAIFTGCTSEICDENEFTKKKLY